MFEDELIADARATLAWKYYGRYHNSQAIKRVFHWTKSDWINTSYDY